MIQIFQIYCPKLILNSVFKNDYGADLVIILIFDTIQIRNRSAIMADIDIFGDEPVVPMEEKEPEDKEELKDGQEEAMNEDQNEGQPEGAIVIPDEKVQDGGVIDDEDPKAESETALAVAETAVKSVEPAKPAEIEPYISSTDTVQVFIWVDFDRCHLITKLH